MRLFSAIVFITAGVIVAFGLWIASLAFPGTVPPALAAFTLIFLFGFAGFQLWMRLKEKAQEK